MNRVMTSREDFARKKRSYESEEFFHSRGRGGPNANKEATGVRLRVFVPAVGLPADVQRRLRKIAGKRITRDGTLIVESTRFRTRGQNRKNARKKLQVLMQRAWERSLLQTPTRRFPEGTGPRKQCFEKRPWRTHRGEE